MFLKGRLGGGRPGLIRRSSGRGRRHIHYRYNGSRRLVGVVGPDSNGGGPLPRQAQRFTYNARGAVTLSETGTVAGPSDPQWAAFNSLQQAAVTYDAWGRATQQRLSAGGTTYSLVQVDHDAAGRRTAWPRDEPRSLRRAAGVGLRGDQSPRRLRSRPDRAPCL